MQGEHFEAVHVFAAPASGALVAHALLVHAPPMLVQSLHRPPPLPQVATDSPPTHWPLLQHPPQLVVSHVVFTSALRAASVESSVMTKSPSEPTSGSLASSVAAASPLSGVSFASSVRAPSTSTRDAALSLPGCPS